MKVRAAILVLSLSLIVNTALAVDLDNNGIEDDLEVELAEKFLPAFVFHVNNPLEPEPVEILQHNTDYPYLNMDDLYIESYYNNGDRAYFGAYCDPQWADCDYGLSEVGPPYGWWNGYYWFAHMEYGAAGDEDGTDWRTNYLNGSGGTPGAGSEFPAKVYVHPFISAGKIVLQYWIFYPFNDWITNHEGDWEHILIVSQ